MGMVGALKVQIMENASMEMRSMKLKDSWKMQYCKRKYEFTTVENGSMENASIPVRSDENAKKPFAEPTMQLPSINELN